MCKWFVRIIFTSDLSKTKLWPKWSKEYSSRVKQTILHDMNNETHVNDKSKEIRVKSGKLALQTYLWCIDTTQCSNN